VAAKHWPAAEQQQRSLSNNTRRPLTPPPAPRTRVVCELSVGLVDALPRVDAPCPPALGAEAVADKGIYLAPSGGSYEINEQNLFVGAINGIAVGGNSNVTVTYSSY
jgi:hypothetical protein